MYEYAAIWDVSVFLLLFSFFIHLLIWLSQLAGDSYLLICTLEVASAFPKKDYMHNS